VRASRWQVLREWPPGYGGIERVAHDLALRWMAPVYSLDVLHRGGAVTAAGLPDPLPVTYPRRRLPSLVLGRLALPLPGAMFWRLVLAREPLHGHLPSPEVLMLVVLCRLLRPRRRVSVHWHAFLHEEAGLQGRCFALYQRVALWLLPCLHEVITTSPVLAAELVRCGCPAERVRILPCCLEAAFERAALALPQQLSAPDQALQVLFIGRLDSYKRLDWLISALASLTEDWALTVVGEGPRRDCFQRQADDLPVRFLGRVDEETKLRCLAQADLLVLPSDRSNEAFGIVQLEAMAAAVPALAFGMPRSGMGWVGRLPALRWSQRPEDLAEMVQRLACNRRLLAQAAVQARARYQERFSREVWEAQLRRIETGASPAG